MVCNYKSFYFLGILGGSFVCLPFAPWCHLMLCFTFIFQYCNANTLFMLAGWGAIKHTFIYFRFSINKYIYSFVCLNNIFATVISTQYTLLTLYFANIRTCIPYTSVMCNVWMYKQFYIPIFNPLRFVNEAANKRKYKKAKNGFQFPLCI